MINIDTACSYLESGLSVLPAVREKKCPVGKWKNWSERLPTRVEVEAWFANRHDAICIVAGSVSGNLECLDFDNKGELFEAWKTRVDREVYARLVVEQSPSGGYHVLYRSQEPVGGNAKLAMGERNGIRMTLIETRGEGGLFLCAPTEGYVLKQGKLEELPILSAVERESLLNAARALDERRGQSDGTSSRNATTGPTDAFLERPGDDFVRRGDIRPYLTANGWQHMGTKPDGNELWRRPGKTSGGHSATFDGHVFYVFSSNAAPFEPEHGYNAFQVYTILEHGGDFTAAARSLIAKGYGTAANPLMDVDLSGLRLVRPGESQMEVMSANTLEPVSSESEDIPVNELVKRYPKLRPELIHGILRSGETMNIIAAPKTGKSWIAADLALAVASGTHWFGYPCETGNVLIIDNELHPETSAARIPKVIEARKMNAETVGRRISIVNLRGHLKSIEDIGNHLAEYKTKEYKLIIIDAFYRAIPPGTDENDNVAIMGLYNMLDRYASEIGCAFCLIHHTSKGNQAIKAVTDVGAGAGAQSRAADTHVVLRKHKEKGVIVFDAVVRSFPPPTSFCLRWNWPVWNREDMLSPEDLEGKIEYLARKRGSEAAVEVDVHVRGVRKLITPEKPQSQVVFENEVCRTYDVSVAKAQSIVDAALDLGYLKRERRPVPTDEGRKVWYILPGPVDPESEEEDLYDESEDE